jgi:hypothetical protein
MIQNLCPKSPPRRIERPEPDRGAPVIGRVDGARIAPRAAFPLRFGAVMVAIGMGIAIAHPGPWAKARAQGVKAENPVRPRLDPAAVRSLLVVRRPAAGNNARPMVALSRAAYAKEIPDFGKGVRPDILARELLRQAILIAARDELRLSTRDEVIDDWIEADRERAGGVEVISFIRDRALRRGRGAVG